MNNLDKAPIQINTSMVKEFLKAIDRFGFSAIIQALNYS